LLDGALLFYGAEYLAHPEAESIMAFGFQPDLDSRPQLWRGLASWSPSHAFFVLRTLAAISRMRADCRQGRMLSRKAAMAQRSHFALAVSASLFLSSPTDFLKAVTFLCKRSPHYGERAAASVPPMVSGAALAPGEMVYASQTTFHGEIEQWGSFPRQD
jgi:hypothetical protein